VSRDREGEQPSKGSSMCEGLGGSTWQNLLGKLEKFYLPEALSGVQCRTATLGTGEEPVTQGFQAPWGPGSASELDSPWKGLGQGESDRVLRET
jgi:hypothetical protein